MSAEVLSCRVCGKICAALYPGDVCREHFDMEAYAKRPFSKMVFKNEEAYVKRLACLRRSAKRRREAFKRRGLTTKGKVKLET
jgi:hypothetical protein